MLYLFFFSDPVLNSNGSIIDDVSLKTTLVLTYEKSEYPDDEKSTKEKNIQTQLRGPRNSILRFFPKKNVIAIKT